MTDLAVRLLREGYPAIDRDRAARREEPTYPTRLLGRRAVVLSGREGARLFYDESVVERSGVVPPPLARLLFGRGAVHGLDGDAHHQRKRMFLDLLTPGAVAPVACEAGDRLATALTRPAGSEVRLFPTLVRAYGAAALGWIGADRSEEESARLSGWYADIVGGFGFAGPAYARAWHGRLRTDAWARRLVRQARSGRVPIRAGTPLATLVRSDLDEHTAAVEIGNMVRPTVAVSWLGVFAALELSSAPGLRPHLAGSHGAGQRLSFAQEVRRATPFVPALLGRARRAASADGYDVRPGDLLVLDVRGINLDPGLHEQPLEFRPDRFRDHQPGPYDMVPQGGGPLEGHRCPGESLTLQLLAGTVRVLAETPYDVVSTPRADLRRIPTLPPDGLRLRLRVGDPVDRPDR